LPVVALSVVFSSQAGRSLAQSVPPEFTRPLRGASKATATPEEKDLFTPLINDLDFKNKPATIEKLTAFIAEHPDVRFGYSFRAAAAGCETSTPDVQMAYGDSKHALTLPKDSFDTTADDTTIAAKAALRLNRPKESVAILADAIIRNPGDSKNLLGSSSGNPRTRWLSPTVGTPTWIAISLTKR
jgi:hypothetical protein